VTGVLPFLLLNDLRTAERSRTRQNKPKNATRAQPRQNATPPHAEERLTQWHLGCNTRNCPGGSAQKRGARQGLLCSSNAHATFPACAWPAFSKDGPVNEETSETELGHTQKDISDTTSENLRKPPFRA